MNWTTNTILTSNLFDEMDQLIEGVSRSVAKSVYDERNFGPKCDIYEAADHYSLSLDAPGMKKEDIRIELSENLLTISGERRMEQATDTKKRIQRYERSFGQFKRSFNLPSSVDSSKVEARYEDGVLELYIPKTEAARPKVIEVQSGKGGIFNKLLGGKKTEAEVKDSNH